MRGKKRPARRSGKPAKAQVEANLFVRRKAPKSGTARVRDLEKRLAEALEQQKATAEILRIISGAPIGLEPVLDAIARNAALVCGAYDALVFLREGDGLRYAAHHGPIKITLQHTTLSRGSITEACILDRRPVHVHDLLATEPPAFPLTAKAAREGGFRTGLSVPLLRENEAIGALSIRRREIQPFTAEQIALLQTFADQAVIAIENVRLFKELEARNHALAESLDQQTATSEILRVISSSPTDTEPVFDAIAESAARLCNANDAQVLRVEGDILHLVAARGTTSMPSVRQLTRGHLVGRAVIDRRTIHVRDLAQALAEYPETTAPQYGIQSALAVPLIREGVALGVIRISRTEIRPFTQEQVALLQTFADQAVIAIENVRLFTELQEKNLALTKAHAEITEALDQQTATAEILRVISRSQTDVQPVFDAIVRSAVTLCDGLFSALYQFDGELVFPAAQYNYTPKALEEMRRIFPAPPDRGRGTGRAILERAVIHIPDVELDPEYQQQALSRAIGWRSGLYIPMLRDGAPIGVIVVTRAESGAFSESEIAVLQTFADQAVIAIENVRLFNELQASNRDLTTALDTQTATSDILRVISVSQVDVQPVFDAIVESAVRLLRGFVAAISRLAGDELELVAFTKTDPVGDAAVKSAFPQALGSEWPHSRVVRERAVLNVVDARSDPQLPEAIRNVAAIRGYQSVLVLPMLRQDGAIGAISVTRRERGGFTDDEIALLHTFADQAVIAIENVRLFTELQDRNREIEHKSHQLEIASQHKSEFLANMSHELRTPLNAVIGFSEVLSEGLFGELNAKQDEYARDIHASGQHLLSLINDILDLSKIEAGRMELELTEFHLPTAIENALTLVRERAGRRGIALETGIDERLGQLQADERKIRQVILNLLSNAIKFTPEGGRIGVTARLSDSSVEISVSDTGIGIAPEDQEAVFEEFRQVGRSDKKAEGTGLGLTLCRKFIELHGGRIWVVSEPGSGSTFTFAIPMHQDASKTDR